MPKETLLDKSLNNDYINLYCTFWSFFLKSVEVLDRANDVDLNWTQNGYKVRTDDIASIWVSRWK